MAISGVPVQLFGRLIATATINDDGTITLQMDGPNDYGKALMQNLEAGHYGGIEMTVMPIPQELQDKDGTRIRGKNERALADFQGFATKTLGKKTA